jgi:uncharacterized protein YcsI (UPF0317 family)
MKVIPECHVHAAWKDDLDSFIIGEGVTFTYQLLASGVSPTLLFTGN